MTTDPSPAVKVLVIVTSGGVVIYVNPFEPVDVETKGLDKVNAVRVLSRVGVGRTVTTF